MEKTAEQWMEEAENIKNEWRKLTGLRPTLEGVKYLVAKLDGIEDVDSYAEELFHYVNFYRSEDKTLINEDPLTLTYNGNHLEYVLSATTDDKGHLTLRSARPDEFDRQSRKYATAKTVLKHGITIVDESGEFIEPQSVGINWDAVKSVEGKTYDVKALIKSKGFGWDKERYMWRRLSAEGLEKQRKREEEWAAKRK